MDSSSLSAPRLAHRLASPRLASPRLDLAWSLCGKAFIYGSSRVVKVNEQIYLLFKRGQVGGWAEAWLPWLPWLPTLPVPTVASSASWQPAAALSRLVKHDFAFYTFANLLSQHFSFTCREGPSVRAPTGSTGVGSRGGSLKVLRHNSLRSPVPGPALVHLSIYQCLPHSGPCWQRESEREWQTKLRPMAKWGWHWPLFWAKLTRLAIITIIQTRTSLGTELPLATPAQPSRWDSQ